MRYSTIVCLNFCDLCLMELLANGVSQWCSPQVWIFIAFHIVISEKESVQLFYKVRNGWNRNG